MRPKLLFLLHLPPPINGAAMVGQYIKESSIINESVRADYINLATSFRLETIGKGGILKMIALTKLLARLVHTLFSRRYDLCYMTLTASGPGFYKDFLVVSVLKLFGVDLIYHFHNKGVKAHSTNVFKRMLYRFVFKDEKVIQLSALLYYDIADYVDKKDVFVCPNGIPPVKARTTREPKNGEPPRKFLFLSNMMKEKGVFVLLDSCRILQEKKLNFECYFVGAWSDVSEEDFNNKVVEYGLEKRVFAVGPKYGEEKIDYFEASDVFVFPTYYHNESFPLVILEAMQYGLPVISTHEGGIPDMVLDGVSGLLTEQLDSDDLANKMEVLIKDTELLGSMGKSGNQRFQEQFTLQIFENRMAKILETTA